MDIVNKVFYIEVEPMYMTSNIHNVIISKIKEGDLSEPLQVEFLVILFRQVKGNPNVIHEKYLYLLLLKIFSSRMLPDRMPPVS